MSWHAPIDDIVFTLRAIARVGMDEADLRAILDEAGRLVAAEEVAPLDRDADLIGARWIDGRVTTPPDFSRCLRCVVCRGLERCGAAGRTWRREACRRRSEPL